jgi:SAM-dependent methyltransferase
MSDEDRAHWDDRYKASENGSIDPLPPPALVQAAHLLPSTGSALELACGRGRAAVWLALQGMRVWGVDVSPEAIRLARHLADSNGVADRCRFEVFDLDDGLPEGPPVDLILCHLFRDHRLDSAIIERLSPGGILAIAVLSEVGAGPGQHRAAPGELIDAFGSLEILASGEADGTAWLAGRKARVTSRGG